MLITYRRSENESTYRNFAEINYEREYKNGLAHMVWIRRARLVPQDGLRFENQIDDMIFFDDALNTAEVGMLLRYSLREAYLQQKRFLLGSAGRLDAVGEVMKVWNKVPFPLFVYPNQRVRHHIENNAFFLNRALEFMADEQYTYTFPAAARVDLCLFLLAEEELHHCCHLHHHFRAGNLQPDLQPGGGGDAATDYRHPDRRCNRLPGGALCVARLAVQAASHAVARRSGEEQTLL